MDTQAIAAAVADREKLRRLHNTAGYGDDPVWVHSIFRPASLAISASVNRYRQEAVAYYGKPDVRLHRTAIKYPAGCTSYGAEIAYLWACQRAAPEDGEALAVRNLCGAMMYRRRQPPAAEMEKPLSLIATDNEPEPDPLIDWTGWTETDPGADITVAANQITVTALPRNLDSRVHKDFGAGYFGTRFIHDIHYELTSSDDSGRVSIWCLSDTLDDESALIQGTENAISVALTDAGANQHLIVKRCADGDSDTFEETATSDRRYVVIEADGTNVDVRAYSDAAKTTLEDTISVAVDSSANRYLMTPNSNNNGGAQTMTLELYNLDMHTNVGGAGLGLFLGLGLQQTPRNR